MPVVVIHRENKRAPVSAMRLCKLEFATEQEAEEYAWRKSRAGAIMLCHTGGEWRGRFPCRLCRGSLPDHPAHGHCRLWKPLSAFRTIEGDPWGEHTIGIPLDILRVICGPLPAVTFTAEGGFRNAN